MSSAKSLFVTLPVCATAIICAATLSRAGDLDPSGAPAPTMKTLDQIEARIPIGPDTTPGDINSVFEITAPGSYYLTGHVLAESGKIGIKINASNVTLDLNGFTLFGAGGGTVGIAAGIDTNGQVGLPQQHVVVRNGFVREWDLIGVYAAFQFGRLENLTVDACGGDGVVVPSVVGLTIEDCVVSQNGGAGISVEGRSTTITGTRIIDNAEQGVESIQPGLEIRACHIAENGLDGLDLKAEARVVDSVITRHETGFSVAAQAPLQMLDSFVSRVGFQQNQSPAVDLDSFSQVRGNYIDGGDFGVAVRSGGERSWIDRNSILGAGGLELSSSGGIYSTFVTRNHISSGTSLIFTGGTFIAPPGVGELLDPSEVETNDRPHSNYAYEAGLPQ